MKFIKISIACLFLASYCHIAICNEVKSMEIKKYVLMINEHRHKLKTEKNLNEYMKLCIHIISRWPQSNWAFSVVKNIIPDDMVYYTIERNRTDPNFDELAILKSIENINTSSDRDKIAKTLIIARMYSIVSTDSKMELGCRDLDESEVPKLKAKMSISHNRAITLYKKILSDKNGADFLPITGMMLLYFDDEEQLDDRMSLIKSVGSGCNEYKFIIDDFQFEKKLQKIYPFSDEFNNIAMEQFNHALSASIDKLTFWEQPYPTSVAFTIACLISSEKVRRQMICKLIPLLNENNDPLEMNGRFYRVTLLKKLSEIHGNHGEYSDAINALNKALELTVNSKERQGILRMLEMYRDKATKNN
jgi:hypothetical protein